MFGTRKLFPHVYVSRVHPDACQDPKAMSLSSRFHSWWPKSERVQNFVFLAPSWPAALWLGEGPQPPMDSSKQIRFPFWPRSFSTQWSHRAESNSFDSLLGEFHFWKLVHSLHPSLKGKDQRTQKVEGSNLILPGGLIDPSLWFLVPGSDASSGCGHRDAAQPDICWMPQAPGVRVV